MCGRFTLISEVNQLKKRYNATDPGGYRAPNYNVAPTQFAPIVTADGLVQARWGLIPGWAKSLNAGYSMINARAETILEKPTYKPLMKTGRCLVPASGFYEWESTEANRKQPVYFTVKGAEIFSLAGLFAKRQDDDGHVSYSFTIITTTPNNLVAAVHDRMPVILEESEEQHWLNSLIAPEQAALMLDSYPAGDMIKTLVSTAVNSTANNSANLLEPIQR